jgi:hypothetical protein
MIDISEYVNKIGEQKKNLVKKNIYQSYEAINYILQHVKNIKENNQEALFVCSIKLIEKEIYQIIVDRLIVAYKKALLDTLLIKEIKKEEFNEFEKSLVDCLKHNIIRKGYMEHSSDKSIYGYRLIENNKQVFYKYNLKKETFEVDQSIISHILDLQKIKDKGSKKLENNTVYGYLKFEKLNKPPVFKIRNIVKGDKKAIKGISCLYKSRHDIFKHLESFNSQTKSPGNKKIMCDDLEIHMRRYDLQKKDNKRWFFNVEEIIEQENINNLFY